MRWLALVAALVLLAGCFDAKAPDIIPEDVGTSVTLDSELAGWSSTCPCPPVGLALPADLPSDAWIEVRIRWDGTVVADHGLRLLTPNGTTLPSERSFDSRRIQVWGAAAGRYEVQITGDGAYQADARIKSTEPADGVDRLPNLATTVPVGIHVGSCDPVESTEQGATRCLRLGNGVANPGFGPLQVYLTYPEGAMALGGMGHFVQQVLQADGTLRERTVSGASFHVAYSHWHYDGLALFSLHGVDEATSLRLGEVAVHKKAGFCFLDWDVMVERETVEGAGGFAETDCLIPLTEGWSNGVSAGWYDFYESALTDQYVDIAGLPDGLYEYVSAADPLASLEESDPFDNAASVLIRLTGDSVEVIEKRGWYHVQDVDDPNA